MKSFSVELEIRWSDLDPNFHVLHSKYYDFAAFCRMAFLVENGLTPELMKEYHVGPILFREECFFKKEIKFGDEISINLKLSKMTTDFSRWSMDHEIWKNGKTLAAAMNIDAAWMDTQKRKLTVPPPVIKNIFEATPKSDNFAMIVK
ncbi:MAG: acyl-CoA thioesterase [Ferruginibacter sp.]